VPEQGRKRVQVQITAAAQEGYKATTRPVTEWLIRAGVRPNTLTSVGALVVIVSAVAFGLGAIRWGAGLLLLSGVIDTLDGDVARATGKTTKFGAFYDSTLDRVGDGATFIGIAAFLLTAPGIRYPVLGAILCMVAVLASLLVSYARARAEGLGLDCRVGLVQRAERIVGLGVPTVLFGAGPEGLLLFWIVAVLALASVITVVQRFVYVYQVTEGGGSPEAPKGP
jgi:CDP-diacylglycerol--glycerol-3-phosphate 3-phosphatidyltransferase